MERFNVVTAKLYEKDGEQKKAWRNVGQLVVWPANGNKPQSFQLELNMFANEKFYIFPAKEREVKPTSDDVIT